MTELPLFPLSGVLLPYGRMPLQIFEPRYLDLVRDCMKTDSAFGVVWIRRGAEVAQPGGASPLLGDYGTSARIIDWDQLPNGLLGLTIKGGDRFDLSTTGVRANGLVVGQVEFRPPLAPAEFESGWQTLLDVLRSLETHPHVQRMELQVDYRDAWQVAYTLIQLLPLEEALKYELLGLDSIDALMAELDTILNQISGEDQD
ncbi:MAG: LON peptidase substrate-binding domain-containing protein [Halioglobus sp.]|nr:LON peptidase substrate-binding domain-containing protein [Halioglobus sp.]